MGLDSVVIYLSLILTVMYGTGLLYFLSDFEEEKCEMTYMFEYPQFIKIPNKGKYEQFSKYGLYAYTEGRFTAKVRRMHFDGIPVLFIPGNAGSYKQVRSLASVALRMALTYRRPYHFDYFTVDLNSELTGLYGPLLYDQLDYVNHSLNQIFDLYKNGIYKPKSIIIIGHSMGGVIAKKLVSQIHANLVSLVIAIAAPLKRPPLIFDHYINEFYNSQSCVNNSTMMTSISGGYSDFLVPPYLSNINEYNSLSIMTTNIPQCWIESNHVQIVWCKQIVLAINRALFDSIDMQTKQLAKNLSYVNMVFKYHLVQNSLNPLELESYSNSLKVDYKGKWIESLLLQYSVEFSHGFNGTHWYMVKLINLPNHEMLTILAINLKTIDWVFACNANLPLGGSKVCTEAIHLTQMSEIVPSNKYKRRYLHINMHELRKNIPELTHVIFRTSPTPEWVRFHVDVHNKRERRIELDLPSWWTLRKKLILKETQKNAVHYEIALASLQHVFQFYQLFVEPLQCQASFHHASASLMVPWGNQNYHTYFTNNDKNPLNIRLYTSKLSDSEIPAIVKLILDPSCTYQLSIKSSIYGLLGQMARIYSPFLITNIATVLLMTLRYQIQNLRNSYCQIFFVAVKEGAKPYYILPIVKAASILFSKTGVGVGLPVSDIFFLGQDGIEFFALPIILFVCSIGIVFVLGIVYLIALVTLESTIHKFTLMLGRRFLFFINYTDVLISILQRTPFIAAGILIFISIFTCGSVALCLGALFYFMKLTIMVQDHKEKIVLLFIKCFGATCKSIIKEKMHKSIIIKCFKSCLEKILNSNSNEKENVTESSSEKRSVEFLLRETEIKQATEIKKDEVELNSISVETNELLATYNSFFFHTTLFFIWCIVTIINVPAALTWSHNFQFNKSLTPDTSFIPGIVFSLCAMPLWHLEFPIISRKWSNELETFIIIIAVLNLVFATVSIYRLNYLLTLFIVLIVLHQLVNIVIIKYSNTHDANAENQCDNKKLKSY